MITFEGPNGISTEVDPATVSHVIASPDPDFTTIYYRADNDHQWGRFFVRGACVDVRRALGLSDIPNEGGFDSSSPETALYIQQKR